MTLRAARRAVALVAALLHCALDFVRRRMRGPLTLRARAEWLQSACQGVLRALGIAVRVNGPLPGSGLLVANHLGYLDIPAIAAATPCAFIAKSDVAHWPFFGFAARASGTLFLDRRSLASAGQVAERMTERLQAPVPILLFPEGTSTDGSSVQRFHSRLFEPAAQAGAPIATATVQYEIAAPWTERDLCWFGDAGFVPHLAKVLNAPGFTIRVEFRASQIYADRRSAAEATHQQIANARVSRAVAAD